MDRTERFWDRQATSFERADSDRDKTWLRTVENAKMHLKGFDIVLDYACATGSFSFALAGEVKEIHGIDISPRMTEAARRNAAERQIENVHFAQATILDERLQRESFTAILALNVLHFPEDTEQVMRRINELLKPEGVLISETACLGEGLPFLRFLLYPLSKLGILPPMRFFKTRELKDLIVGSGFQIVETERISHGPALIYYIVANQAETS